MATIEIRTSKDPKGWPHAPRDGTGRRILFVNPPSIPYNALVRTFQKEQAPLNQTVSMPMGILYLSSTLERDLPGIAIDIVDLAIQYREHCDRKQLDFPSFEDFCEQMLRSGAVARPDVIGISVLFSTAHKSTLKIAEVCKKIWPDVPIIVGGMHATNSVEQLLANPAVDYVCRGEGEAIIADIVLDPCSQPRGLVGRSNIEAKESAPLIYDLDTIPHPAWHLLPMNDYVFAAVSRARNNMNSIEQDGAATIVTTRGCPFHCTFCSSWTVHGREMRYRSKENVVEELQILSQRYGVNTVIPEDDLFSVKKPRFIELCNAIADEFQDSLHFQFPNGLSVATLDADVIAAMKRMGMTVANIAIESGSHFTQRKIIKKNVDLDRARSVVAECRRQNLTVRTYFILGFPGETREQMQETIDFAGTLECDWATIHPAAPLAGTEMFDQLIARGDIDKSFNWDEAFFQERLYDTPEIGAQELKDLAYRANLQLNFFGNFNLRNGNYGHAIELFEDIVRVYPGHLAANVCLSKALALAGRDEEAAEVWKSAEKLVEENSWMAVHQLERYPDLFPWFNSTAKADVSTHWPRPGLPTAARQHA